jgi:diketogulonate reductase-like aldo/keto reductase
VENVRKYHLITISYLTDEIFFTTKLRDPDHGYENTKAAIETSLAKWGHGYIDLYLIHSPLPGTKKRLEAWRAIEEAIEAGKIKSGGVSNYGVHHLQELLNSKPKILPSINQVELHPFLQRKDIDDFCKEHGIYLEGIETKYILLMR